jgi:hypothetical protein
MIQIIANFLGARQPPGLTDKLREFNKIAGICGKRISRKTLLDPAMVEEHGSLAAQIGCGLHQHSRHRANDTISR